jgi:ADP-ribosylglycohydrolase/protein-tyrosine phosphatase
VTDHETPIADRLAGAVWGQLIGDAVGVPYEFKDPGAITSVHFGVSGSHHQPPGTWSDDGALMLGLLDSLLRDRGSGESEFDTADQAKRFLAWFNQGAYTPDGDGRFDIGNATRAALDRLRRGVTPEQAGGTTERDNGNGALMRILPLALVDRDGDTAELIDRAHRASAVTHGHAISQVTCAFYVLIAHYLLLGVSRESAFLRARGTLGLHYQGHDPARGPVFEQVLGWTGRSGRGYVVDSFWSAWEALAGATSYRDTVERAVRYGHDTDTTAAIAGGLAGIRFGLSGIPPHWLAKMRGRDIVDPLVARLVGAPVAAANPTPTPTISHHGAAPAYARTSVDHPIRVDWVDPAKMPPAARWTGRLGMTILPGKHDYGIAGHHWRELGLDVARLREVEHADTFVLLVEDHELVETETTAIADLMAAHEIELLRLPIVDHDVPADLPAFRSLLSKVSGRLTTGHRVVVACRGGLGRTGTLVACLLVEAGLSPAGAVTLTRHSRQGTLETPGQEAFVMSWASAGRGPEGSPFDRYEAGGRTILPEPRERDGTARHGYGLDVFAQCGYTCVYCGLDMAATFEAWLQLSVDHVVPRQMRERGFQRRHVESVSNLVTCCRACNDLGNRYIVDDPAPQADEAFLALRDRVFQERQAMIRRRRDEEMALYRNLVERSTDSRKDGAMR